jgi:phage shock protein PspC (stress-responsive transcriptional regulator)
MTAPPAPPFLDPPAYQPPPPPPGPPVRGQLRRSRTDKVIGGVAGGLAQYSGIDALLWRVGLVALAFAGGTGVLVYLLLWLLMPAGPAAPVGYVPDAAPAAPAGPRSPVPGLTIAVLLIVVGVLALLPRLTEWSPGPRVFVAAALLVVGLGLLAAAFIGGRTAKGGLITLGIVLSLALLIASATPWDGVRAGIGDRTYTPATAEAVRSQYHGGVGDVRLDLSRIDVSDLDEPVRTTLNAGIGDVDIVVPPDADISLDVNNGIGDVEIFGSDAADGGFWPAEGSSWLDEGDPDIVLTINAGVGDVEVLRG